MYNVCYATLCYVTIMQPQIYKHSHGIKLGFFCAVNVHNKMWDFEADCKVPESNWEGMTPEGVQ